MSAVEALSPSSSASGSGASAPSSSPTRRGPGFWRLFASELRLVIGRRRNQMGLLVLVVPPIVLALAQYHDANRHGGDGGGPDFVNQILSNGLFVPLAALGVEVTMFIPLAIAMLSGDAIAGEAHGGTLRYLLTVPVGRTRLLLVKLASLVTASLVACGAVALVGLTIGTALFGAGAVTTLSGSSIGFGAGLVRLLVAVLYLSAAMSAMGAVGLFVSTLTEQPIAVMVAVMITNIVMYIADSLSQLAFLHPWLLVDRIPAFADVMRNPVDWSAMTTGLWVFLGYFVVFGLAAWARFSGKDVTS